MDLYWGYLRKDSLGSELAGEPLLERTLWGNFLPGKLVSIPACRIITVLDEDWTFMRGRWIFIYVINASFVWLHVDTSVNMFKYLWIGLLWEVTKSLLMLLYVACVLDMLWDDAWCISGWCMCWCMLYAKMMSRMKCIIDACIYLFFLPNGIWILWMPRCGA